MNEPQQPPSPRRRLQELLAIPDRDRTEAEWDELNELEIMLASGNREKGPGPGPGPGPDHGMRRNAGPQPAGHRKPGGQPQGQKKQIKKFRRRPPKGNPPQ